MGQTIPGIPRTYGSTDSDKMKADLYEVAKNSGTSGSPIYALDGTRKQRLDELAANLVLVAGFIRADGTIPMDASLNLDNNNIHNVITITDNENIDSVSISGRALYDAVGNLIAKWIDAGLGFGVVAGSAHFVFFKTTDLTSDITLEAGRAGTIAVTSDIPEKVASAPTIALLENDSNWTNNRYTGSTAITGQKTGDWYDNGEISYKFVTGTSLIRRIPYANL